jgi:hypothetical protein
LFERGLAAAREAGLSLPAALPAPLALATGSRAQLEEPPGGWTGEHPRQRRWMLGYEAYLSLAQAWLGHDSRTRAHNCWHRCGRRGPGTVAARSGAALARTAAP